MVAKHGFVVLSSDFEGVCAEAGYSEVLNQGKRQFKKSKVQQGRYLAENMGTAPKELSEIIRRVTLLAKR